MNFNFQESIQILEKTPQTLHYFLTNLSDSWLHCNEGDGTWNPKEVIEHLIEAEKTNWVSRTEAILDPDKDSHFEPFNRFSHLNQKPRSIEESIAEFQSIRFNNLNKLRTMVTSSSDFDKVGIHPELGPITLGQLISTWVVHDLTHITQIARVMAKRYNDDVGPWSSYLSILQK
ncbi:DinB family protein [Ornithinibacillus scapharcae]|uniref:DinB family protein n=1 Tax=Ornithinibacillus scapharcae TaxID=1147159 RepID=UPI000225B378|nr:DinB family protein [Ornithinibacillus scapharcae]